MVDVDASELALPVGCPTAFPKPSPRWCSTPAPRDGPGVWDRTIELFRAAPGALVEPWAGSVVNSTEKCRSMLAEVPGLRLLVDTGHVADWGGDPLDLLADAAHVQLRQGRPGAAQAHVDDPGGVVDFPAVIDRLDALRYDGLLSVEYFDLPDAGWPLADPRRWALDLTAALRPLLA
ncbi:MAG: sugar phosphate isomerase/epimerase family protein [Acidimicrobiia bacterium]